MSEIGFPYEFSYELGRTWDGLVMLEGVWYCLYLSSSICVFWICLSTLVFRLTWFRAACLFVWWCWCLGMEWWWYKISWWWWWWWWFVYIVAGGGEMSFTIIQLFRVRVWAPHNLPDTRNQREPCMLSTCPMWIDTNKIIVFGPCNASIEVCFQA